MFKLGDRSILEVLKRGLTNIGDIIQTKHGYYKINSLASTKGSLHLEGMSKRINDTYCIACIVNDLIHWVELEHVFDIGEVDIKFNTNHDPAYVGSNAN